MFRIVPFLRIKQNLSGIFFPIFIIISYLIFSHFQKTAPPNVCTVPNTVNYNRYEQFCQDIDSTIRSEPKSYDYQVLTIGENPIPYLYSQWQSTPLMPRLMVPYEHATHMHLLSLLITYVFEPYKIQYMMMAATLLGSYTRHDILPFDDDVDLCISIADRIRFQSAVIGHLSGEPYSVILMQMHNERNYDKVFLGWCPRAGETAWRFPFIDIFYQDQNSSHVWLLGKPSSCPVPVDAVFPLVLRPLGSLWLYAPREPMIHFESRKMVDIETSCICFTYSHRYERHIRNDAIYAECDKLRSFYPYVERKCTSTRCIEYLKLGNDTLIHKVVYDYAYRTSLYPPNKNSSDLC